MEDTVTLDLCKLLKGMSDEEVAKWFEDFRAERAVWEQLRIRGELEVLLKSQTAVIGQRMPILSGAFDEEISRIAGWAWQFVADSKGSLLPTVMPGVGSRDKRFPIRGLLKIAKISHPKDMEIEQNKIKHEPDVPYVLIGINTIVLENVSPKEAKKECNRQSWSRPPFELEDVAAIFIQGTDYFGVLPYSILIPGSSWNGQAVVMKSELGGKRTLIRVPWDETISGKVIVPKSAGAEHLIFHP